MNNFVACCIFVQDVVLLVSLLFKLLFYIFKLVFFSYRDFFVLLAFVSFMQLAFSE